MLFYESTYFIQFIHLCLLRALVLSLRPAILIVILNSDN